MWDKLKTFLLDHFKSFPTSLLRWIYNRARPSCHIVPDLNLSSVGLWERDKEIGADIHVPVYIYNPKDTKLTIHPIGLSRTRLNKHIDHSSPPIIINKLESQRSPITFHFRCQKTWWNKQKFRFLRRKEPNVTLLVEDNHGNRIRIKCMCIRHTNIS